MALLEVSGVARSFYGVTALSIAARSYILVDGRNRPTGPASELPADPDVRRIFPGG